VDLNQVAHQMLAQIAHLPDGRLQLTPPGDLTLALQRDHDRYHLALGRVGLPLVVSDVRRLAAAFGVPEGTEPTVTRRQERHPRSGCLIDLYIIELQWTERGR
jgi:hypothetical protein